MQILIITALLIVGCFAAIITWKVSPHFLSRSDLYHNSRFAIMKRKLTWASSAFFMPVVVYGFLYLGFSKKNVPVVVDSKATVAPKTYKAKKPVKLKRRLPVLDAVPQKEVLSVKKIDSVTGTVDSVDSLSISANDN